MRPGKSASESNQAVGFERRSRSAARLCRILRTWRRRTYAPQEITILVRVSPPLVRRVGERRLLQHSPVTRCAEKEAPVAIRRTLDEARAVAGADPFVPL